MLNFLAKLAFFLGLLLLYAATLQTIPNGSSHPYMIDVGETQVALNTWGTLHATGYPLYTALGNLFTLPARLWINPAAAAGLFSTLWTLLALIGLYALLTRITRQPLIVAAGVGVLAVARSIWIHSVIAEVYSLSLAIFVGLWLIALWPTPPRPPLEKGGEKESPSPFKGKGEGWGLSLRVWGVAFLGGIGVFHHRALAFGALGLLIALWPELNQQRRRLPFLMLTALPLALLGFLPYLYLPLRAADDSAQWIYARDVTTWDGFWFQFWGREADYLITRPDTLQGWLDNLEGTLGILGRELSPLGAGVAGLCLLLACILSPYRRLAWTAAGSAAGYFAFAVSYHRAVLPEAILMLALPSLIVGVVLMLIWLAERARFAKWVGLAVMLVWAGGLVQYQHPFIRELLTDETGLNSVEAARAVPEDEDAILMLSWGPRYFAASYARLVTDEAAHIQIVDHRADFPALARAGHTFYTEPDTLFGYPVAWWEARLGQPVYVTSAGVNLLHLRTAPALETLSQEELRGEVAAGIWLRDYGLTCDDEHLTLRLDWYALRAPDRDLSAFVHLVGAETPFLIAPEAGIDWLHPVNGWRPTSSWLAGETVREDYRLPRLPGGERLRFGMYERLPDGSFATYGETFLPLTACASG